MEIKTLVLTGDGINCDLETKRAFELAGSKADRVHINQFFESPDLISNYQILALPGGFSFGDDLGSGKVLALKMKLGLKDAIDSHLERGGLVIGICNGFQALVKMGLLPRKLSTTWKQVASLTLNEPLGFIDCWVDLKINPKSTSPWLNGITALKLPIRHGEGRLVFERDSEFSVEKLKASGEAALFYEKEINGSDGLIAGLIDETGQIFGLMPHPEVFTSSEMHPDYESGETPASHEIGLQFFKNAVSQLKQNPLKEHK